jgi:hypothetical protein
VHYHESHDFCSFSLLKALAVWQLSVTADTGRFTQAVFTAAASKEFILFRGGFKSATKEFVR